jgi:hypothetical protein
MVIQIISSTISPFPQLLKDHYFQQRDNQMEIGTGQICITMNHAVHRHQ